MSVLSYVSHAGVTGPTLETAKQGGDQSALQQRYKGVLSELMERVNLGVQCDSEYEFSVARPEDMYVPDSLEEAEIEGTFYQAVEHVCKKLNPYLDVLYSMGCLLAQYVSRLLFGGQTLKQEDQEVPSQRLEAAPLQRVDQASAVMSAIGPLQEYMARAPDALVQSHIDQARMSQEIATLIERIHALQEYMAFDKEDMATKNLIEQLQGELLNMQAPSSRGE